MANKTINGRSAKKPLLFAVGFLIILFAALPTAIILMIGMVPTLVAFIIDRTPGRYLMKCVAGMNLAGVVPWLYHLWITGHDMIVAMDMASDPFVWFAIYGASGMGWLLFLGLPGAVAMSRVLNAKRRIFFLREGQKSLFNEWGECILPPSELRNLDGAEEEDEHQEEVLSVPEPVIPPDSSEQPA